MIVVAGALGSTGTELVAELVARKVPVRALVRDEKRARERLPPGIDLGIADVRDRAALDRALAGAEAVYGALGGPNGSPDLEAVECGLVDAARAAGVKRYVKVS